MVGPQSLSHRDPTSVATQISVKKNNQFSNVGPRFGPLMPW